jgi:ferric-dicitrate binding protein FerR (iron transport regulator)
MTRIVVRGEALQSRRISGVFRIGDVDTEVLVLQRYFGQRGGALDERDCPGALDRGEMATIHV